MPRSGLSETSSILVVEDDAKHGTMCARLLERKGYRARSITSAREALAMLEGDLRLILAGPLKHAAASVREAIERLGLGDRVQLRGNLQKDELAKLYRGARCFVFPSRYEGFGLPILEAMACGTPVVTTTAGSIPEVAGDAAILVPPSEAEALADGVRRALPYPGYARVVVGDEAPGRRWEADAGIWAG